MPVKRLSQTSKQKGLLGGVTMGARLMLKMRFHQRLVN